MGPLFSAGPLSCGLTSGTCLHTEGYFGTHLFDSGGSHPIHLSCQQTGKRNESSLAWMLYQMAVEVLLLMLVGLLCCAPLFLKLSSLIDAKWRFNSLCSCTPLFPLSCRHTTRKLFALEQGLGRPERLPAGWEDKKKLACPPRNPEDTNAFCLF